MGDAPGRRRRSPRPTARSPPRRSTSSGRPPRTAPSRTRPSGPDAPRCRRAPFPSSPGPRCRTGPHPSGTPSDPPGPGSRTSARPKPDLFGADTGRTLAQPPAGRRDRAVAETGPHRTGRTGTPADVSLFDSPTARVSSPSRPPGPPRRPIPPSTAGDPRRPVPLDLPPAGSDDVPLFGEAPAPDARRARRTGTGPPAHGTSPPPGRGRAGDHPSPGDGRGIVAAQQHRARPAGPAAGRARRPGTPPPPVPASPHRRRSRRQRTRGERPRGRRARRQRARGRRAGADTDTGPTDTARTGTTPTGTARTGTGTARPATAPHPTCPADPRVATFVSASRHLCRRESPRSSARVGTSSGRRDVVRINAAAEHAGDPTGGTSRSGWA